MKMKISKLLVLVWLLVGLVVLSAALPAMGQSGLNSGMSKAEPKAAQYKFVTLATGTAVQASTTNLQFTAATFYGVKAVSATAAPTANTESAYVGFKDATGASGVTANSPAFCDTITAGSYVSLTQTGTKYDLKDVYFLGTTGDKVLIVYTQ
jgi:hypothetical protein